MLLKYISVRMFVCKKFNLPGLMNCFYFRARSLFFRFLFKKVLFYSTFFPLINQVIWGWGFALVVVQLAIRFSPTTNSFFLNSIFGAPVCLTAEIRGCVNIWCHEVFEALTNNMKMHFTRRLCENWIIDRHFTVVASRRFKVEIL